MYAHVHTQIHIEKYIHTETHTCTHTHIRTHTYTHTDILKDGQDRLWVWWGAQEMCSGLGV